MVYRLTIKRGSETQTIEPRPYISLHRAVLTAFPHYNPQNETIYASGKVISYRNSVKDLMESGSGSESGSGWGRVEVIPKTKGGIEIPAKSAKSGMFYLIAFLVSLSPIYFMYVGIVPLKSYLSKRILSKALEPIGKYLVCIHGKKTLYRRMLTLASILKYFVFILAIFVTFTLPFIALCVMVASFMNKKLMNNPSLLRSPVKAGSTTGMIFTTLYMVIYFGYRWFDYFADFLISIFNESYYTRMMIVPILEIAKKMFDTFKGVGAMIGTFGFAADVPIITAPIAGVVGTLEEVVKKMKEVGCEAVGVDDVEKAFRSAVKGMDEAELKKFEIKGRDRKKFCFDFNEYLDENEFEKLCSLEGAEQCCTPSVFYKIAAGMFGVVTMDNFVAEMVRKGFAAVKMMGHLITANIAFFEETLEGNGMMDQADDGFFISVRQLFIRDTGETKGEFVSEMDLEEMVQKLTANPDKDGSELKAQTLFDEKYKDYKKNIVGVLNIKKKVTFDEVKEKILKLKRMLSDYNASYKDDDVIVKQVFKPLFLSSICEALNGARVTRDFSVDVGGLSNAVDMLRSGMFTGRWMIVFFLITYLILLICGLFKVY